MIGEGARGSPAQIWQWFSPAHLLLLLFFCHGCRAGLGLGPGLFDVLAAGEDRPQNISLPPLWQPCIRLLFLSQGARLLASHCLAGPSGFSYLVLLFQHSASSFFLFLFSLFSLSLCHIHWSQTPFCLLSLFLCHCLSGCFNWNMF